MKEQNSKDKMSFFKRIGASFSRKGFRSGLYAAVTSVLVIAAVIIVNMIASASNVEKDLTLGGQKSLTEDTKELLATVDDELTFYFLTKEGETLAWLDPAFEMYMELYQDHCDKITFKTVDMLLNPKFAEQYTDQAVIQYSIIVVNEATGLSRFVSSDNMVLTESIIDQYTFQYTSAVVGLDIEGQINSAIRYVTSGQQTKLYAVVGHEEWQLDEEGQKLLQKANIEYNTLETMTVTAVPEDCDILFVANPNKDYTDAELQMLLDYADAGGNFLVLAAKQEGLNNFDRFLADCGVQVENRVILEGDSKYHNPASQLELYPILETDNDIMKTMAGSYLPMFTAFGMKMADNADDYTAYPILSTSEASYAKSVQNGQINLTKEATDPTGPFRIGYYTKNEDTKSEAVILSSGYVFQDSYLMISNYGNAGLLVNSINYLTDAEAVEPIRTLSFDTEEVLTITAAQANTIAIVMVIALPVILIVAGIYVMLRRRSR
ncbi:MAG: Gldg family protein [Lachnospiraceae bacterium]|nr:Gldg family protein [Lachnospiraceae bacterium]